jgi:AraC-like DNA-binding protein
MILNTNMRLLMGGSYSGGMEWAKSISEIDKCFKVYRFKEGKSIIQSCQDSIELVPGNIYFINGHAMVGQDCPDHMAVDWFHFQPESLYIEQILKSALCVLPFKNQELLTFIHLFEKLEDYFHKRISNRDEKVFILEIQSLINYMAAQILGLSNISLPDENFTLNRLLPALDYINNHYKSNITLELLADLCHFSPNYFNRLFSTTFFTSPLKYVQKRRLEDASRLLIYTHKQIKAIAYEVGYEDAAYFSRLFSLKYTLSPVQYRIEKRRKLP